MNGHRDRRHHREKEKLTTAPLAWHLPLAPHAQRPLQPTCIPSFSAALPQYLTCCISPPLPQPLRLTSIHSPSAFTFRRSPPLSYPLLTPTSITIPCSRIRVACRCQAWRGATAGNTQAVRPCTRALCTVAAAWVRLMAWVQCYDWGLGFNLRKHQYPAHCQQCLRKAVGCHDDVVIGRLAGKAGVWGRALAHLRLDAGRWQGNKAVVWG